jgi:hypothetical protein
VIDPIAAARILDRLVGQWPGMAATDAAADDWIRAIRNATEPDAVADLLIDGWTRDRGPRVADWHETARQYAQRRHLERQNERPAIEAPKPIDRDRLDALLAQAQAALTEGRRKQPTATRAPVSRYDEMPVTWGEHLMTPEEREAELAKFGDRKVRKRKL